MAANLSKYNAVSSQALRKNEASKQNINVKSMSLHASTASKENSGRSEVYFSSRSVHALIAFFLVAALQVRNSAFLVILVCVLDVGVLMEVTGAELLAIEHCGETGQQRNPPASCRHNTIYLLLNP
jgi:hypothetical protein